MQAELNDELMDAVVQNGIAMLEDLDFKKEIETLELGFFDFTKKADIIKEFKALYLALWHFAVWRSFPDNHALIYEHFLQQKWFWKENEKAYIVEYAQNYFEKLHERGVDDFTLLAKHILSFCEHDESKEKAYLLKLVLLMRAHYSVFFEKLLVV